MILAGDIGGTHTRLGLFSLAQGKLVPEAEATYLSQEHASLDEIAQAFIAAHRCPLRFRPDPLKTDPGRGRKRGGLSNRFSGIESAQILSSLPPRIST